MVGTGKPLRDVIAPDLDVLFCGINPSLMSAERGHHFARPGNRFWPALHLAGLTPRRLTPDEDDLLPGFGLGVTNVVARPTRTAAELTTDELRAGEAEPPPPATSEEEPMSGFERYELSRVDVGEVTLRVRVGGSGPPLLLLHGYPQTHLMWSGVAAALSEDFTVVAPDLRGYGESSQPATVATHETFGKRVMATDGVALMHRLGFDRFDVAGHDRGGRVAYRMALDSPDAVRRVTVLDVVPTGEVWARADARFALGYWHWAFLAQPEPVPETIIGADPEHFFLDAQFGGMLRTFAPEAVADYARALRDPAVVHAICEDYRAGASCDRQADDDDRAAARTIAAPLQVLWAGRGALAAWYEDPLEIWRAWADDVTGAAIDSGHFIVEEKPAAALTALQGFHTTGR